MHYLKNLVFAAGLSIVTIGGVTATELTDQELCAIDQAEAAAAYAQCVSQANIMGMRERLSEDEVELLSMECEAEMLDQVTTLARTLGRQCGIESNAAEAPDWSQLQNHHQGSKHKKPQIPLEEFEWRGTFMANGKKPSDPQIKTRLVIRGQWQTVGNEKFFNVYMQQGCKDDKCPVWVENLVYQNNLYTVTHKWHLEIPWYLSLCARTPNITVHDLNGILLSSRLVGLEKIGGQRMNHFRTTCLTGTPVTGNDKPLNVNIYSDIYVRPGRSYPWERWLQFGEGVGLDSQNDEWFLFNKWNNSPKDIELPLACYLAIPVEQRPCENLVDAESE